ncbi:hypothetical protein [Actinomadura litoris]|uniref:hypothetical protein n=1 Tax=Actinomadura litoris TaxID=2678616 RepID=UPI001FA70294|nr:hypothetical protein [Actinomadura litoris]
MTRPGDSSAVRAAAAALGEPLSDPVPLGDPGDCAVLRCRRPGGGTVIVKTYADARNSFTAEASGLALAVGGPDLLAVDTGYPLVVMADLGAGPSLTDLLLGADPQAARDGLLGWARGLGAMARAGHGRQGELDRLRREYGRDGDPPAKVSSTLRGIGRAPAALGEAGIEVPDGLAEEIDELGRLADDGYPAFTPGDTCPDNNMLTPGGLRFLDFEASGHPSAFLTAAYCRMPFSSCWCVFGLDPALAALVEETYRAGLLEVYPDLADDGAWRAGVRRGIAAWTALTLLLVPDAVAGDPPLNRRATASPTIRRLLVHRCGMLRDELLPAGEYPALAEAARRVLELSDEWGAAPLSPYPAFA